MVVKACITPKKAVSGGKPFDLRFQFTDTFVKTAAAGVCSAATSQGCPRKKSKLWTGNDEARMSHAEGMGKSQKPDAKSRSLGLLPRQSVPGNSSFISLRLRY